VNTRRHITAVRNLNTRRLENLINTAIFMSSDVSADYDQ
jgi:hypothetical protein